LIRSSLIALTVLALVLGSYLGLVAGRRRQERALPVISLQQRGGDPIGRIQRQLTTGALDPTAPSPAHRTVSVWLWYPAQPALDLGRAAYAPGPWKGLHLPGVVGFGEGSFDRLRTRSIPNASIGGNVYGLVILQPGMGFAAPQYQTLAENLAAAGYVVAGITPTYSANLTVIDGRAVRSSSTGNPPDLGGHHGPSAAAADRLVALWAADAVAVSRSIHRGKFADRLHGHLRNGTLYVGHSFGGAAALQACATDNVCRGAVDLDGTQFGSVVRTGVRHPVLLLGSGDSCVTGRCPEGAKLNRGDLAAARSLVRHSGHVSTRVFDGTRHFGFTDYAAYYLAAPLTRVLALGDQDGPKRLAAICAAVAAFAHRTLPTSH